MRRGLRRVPGFSFAGLKFSAGRADNGGVKNNNGGTMGKLEVVAGDFFSIFENTDRDNAGRAMVDEQNKVARVQAAVRARFAKKWGAEVEMVVRNAWSR